MKKYDFKFLFRSNFNTDLIRDSTTTTVCNSIDRTLGRQDSSIFERPGDYMQALIDQLFELHFTACHAGALVSMELTSRKMSILRELKSAKTIEELTVELNKTKDELAEADKSIASLANHLSQAWVDVCKVEEKVKEAEERANKAMDALEVEQVSQTKKWTSFNELEKATQVLPEFNNLVRNMANRSFDFVTDGVRKLAPKLDLSSIYKANEACWTKRTTKKRPQLINLLARLGRRLLMPETTSFLYFFSFK